MRYSYRVDDYHGPSDDGEVFDYEGKTGRKRILKAAATDWDSKGVHYGWPVRIHVYSFPEYKCVAVGIVHIEKTPRFKVIS